MHDYLPMVDGKPPFRCAACHKGFFKKSHLHDHLYGRIKGKSLIHEICRKGVSEVSELNDYFRKYMITKAWECDIAFFDESDLIEHCSVHSNKKTYVCEPCFRIFTNKGSLCVHIATHYKKLPTLFSERQFICQFCKERFSCKSHLLHHIALICDKIEKQKYLYIVCKLCGEVFDDKESFSAHNREDHTLFYCELCDIQFTLKKNLIKHRWKFHKIPKYM